MVSRLREQNHMSKVDTTQADMPLGPVGDPSFDGRGQSWEHITPELDSSLASRPPEKGHDPESAQYRSRRLSLNWIPILIGDAIALLGAVIVGLLILDAISNAAINSLSHFRANFLMALTFVLVGLVTIAAYGLYHRRRRRLLNGSFGDMGHLIHAMVVAGLVSFGAGALAHRLFGTTEPSATQLAMFAVLGIVFVPAVRAVSSWLQASITLSAKGRKPTRVLLIGSGTMVERVGRYLAGDPNIELVGSVDDDTAPGSISIGRTADVPRICEELSIDRVLIGFSRTHPSDVLMSLRPLLGNVAISIVPRYFELLSWQSRIDDICGLPVIDVPPPHLSLAARFLKRTVDIIGAALGLLFVLPIAIVVGTMIKLGSPGPLLFKQRRIGRGGHSFLIYKFRTMYVGAEDERDRLTPLSDSKGPLFKLREDPRITPIGRLLRRTSLDELPQLINVLRGDMSLVGPRPFIAEESRHIDGWAARRFEVRPGLTGPWQISGRNDLDFDEMRRLDYLYVASWSLWWDLSILWHTPASAIRRRGAY
jgi:exopolysaccharide biosynthesis polyprenyl glycosylphosphotransferase